MEAKVGKDRPMCSISKPRYIRYTSCCAVVGWVEVGGGVGGSACLSLVLVGVVCLVCLVVCLVW